MPDVKISPKPLADPLGVRFIRACLGLLRSTTYQGSICLAFAGAATLAAMAAKVPTPQIPVVFLVAMGLPLPFIKYLNTPTRVAGREIRKLRAMARQKLITSSQCKRCEEIVMHWLESQLAASLSQRSGEAPPDPPAEETAPAKADRKSHPPRR
jgi:hypothetical protein